MVWGTYTLGYLDAIILDILGYLDEHAFGFNLSHVDRAHFDYTMRIHVIIFVSRAYRWIKLIN